MRSNEAAALEGLFVRRKQKKVAASRGNRESIARDRRIISSYQRKAREGRALAYLPSQCAGEIEIAAF